MNSKARLIAGTIFFGMAFLAVPCGAFAQAPNSASPVESPAETTVASSFASVSTPDASSAALSDSALPDAPAPQTDGQAGQNQPGRDQTSQDSAAQDQAAQKKKSASDAKSSPDTKSNPDASAAHRPPPQPKRILGLMPNYRAVSAGEVPPPPTPRQAFKIATENSFDYSSFIFVGITSMLAEGSDAHPQLGKGVGGYWAYYWRGYVDKTDGNYWVIFALPTVLHEDERYYARGEGEIFKRGVYASTRILITPNYRGKKTINGAELLGRGIASAISLTYYPSKEQTFGTFAEKYGYALGRDALTNTFREFWPDIAVHVLHRHP
jgi:hypothetical protein